MAFIDKFIPCFMSTRLLVHMQSGKPSAPKHGHTNDKNSNKSVITYVLVDIRAQMSTIKPA